MIFAKVKTKQLICQCFWVYKQYLRMSYTQHVYITPLALSFSLKKVPLTLQSFASNGNNFKEYY